MLRPPRALVGLALACCAVVFSADTLFAQDSPTPFPRRNFVTETVAKTKQGIVAIKVPRANGKDTVGTGIVVDERGFLLTNRHVVGAARSVQVTLPDGSTTAGEVVILEKALDLAIVRIAAGKGIQPLILGPASDLLVGENVVAVGHPYGYTNTVTTGIIGALEREIELPTGDVLTGLIQHDAGINPGNSGGPLLNINGEVIGLNVALRDGAQGIAFAINSNTLKHVLGKHLSALKVAGVQHGLACREKVLAETGPDRLRVVVAECAPALTGELLRGDEIRSVGQRPVHTAFDVERALWDKQVGAKVDLTVLRAGKQLTIALVLHEGAAEANAAVALQPVPNQEASAARTPAAAPSAHVVSGPDQRRR